MVIPGVAAGRGDRVGVGQAQHGDGADQEGVDQDIILQQTVLSGNKSNSKTQSLPWLQFDDYNWDWSLQQISQHCLKEKLQVRFLIIMTMMMMVMMQVMMMKGPRVFHIGECGVHHTKKDCDSSAGIEKVKSIIKSAKNYLFPPR